MKININDVVRVCTTVVGAFEKAKRPMVKVLEDSKTINSSGRVFLVRKLWGDFDECQMSEAHFKKVVA